MKKLALALSVVAVAATPFAFGATSAGAAAGDSTLNCNNFGDSNRCTATDPDGINYIRIVDATTGQLVKSVDLACSDNVTKKGFNFPATQSNRFRIRIADCAGNVDTYSESIPFSVFV